MPSEGLQQASQGQPLTTTSCSSMTRGPAGNGMLLSHVTLLSESMSCCQPFGPATVRCCAPKQAQMQGQAQPPDPLLREQLLQKTRCSTLISGIGRASASAADNSPYVRVKRRTGSAGAGGAEARRNSSERRSSRLANSEPPYSMRHMSWPAALLYPFGRAMCRTTQPRCTRVLGGRAAASARASWCKP